MLIVISQTITRAAEDKTFVVAFNLDNCEGLSVFNCAVCVLINGRNEMIARFKTHEEALALVDDIIEAMRSGATVFDCNGRRQANERQGNLCCDRRHKEAAAAVGG